jgi:TonB family protein
MVIANDYSRTRVPAASSAAVARGFVTLADRNFGYFSLRSATLFLIAGLHAALFYGLITTLSHTRASATPSNLQNSVVKPVPPETSPPPQQQNIDVESDTIEDTGKSPEPYSTPPPPETPTHVVRQVAGGPGAGFPETSDFYPSLSIRLGEEGISTVRVCVDAKGRLSSDPTTLKGSGNARLDEGALKLARAGSGHYRATTEDGQPVTSCYPLGIRFQLRK